MAADDNIDGHEEPNIPEKFTKSELRSWADARNRRIRSPTNQHDVSCDKYGILHDSEQHQQGLSVFMKRCRRDIILKRPRPDLTQATTSRMAAYLQDIQRFNPELMIRTETMEHCSLPTTAIIEDEKRVMKAESRKPWQEGIIIRNSSNLIDPAWRKEKEVQFVEKIQRKTREKSAHVLMGVLQQWRKSQERKSSPITPQPTSIPDLEDEEEKLQLLDQDSEIKENEQKEEQEQNTSLTNDPANSDLSTLHETEEIDQEDSVLRHSSR